MSWIRLSSIQLGSQLRAASVTRLDISRIIILGRSLADGFVHLQWDGIRVIFEIWRQTTPLAPNVCSIESGRFDLLWFYEVAGLAIHA